MAKDIRSVASRKMSVAPADQNARALTLLKTRALKLFSSCQGIEVKDTPTFERAGSLVKDAVAIRKDLQKLPFYVALQEAKADVKLKDSLVKSVERLIKDAETGVRDALEAYAAKQREAQNKLVERALDKGDDVKAASIQARPFVPAVSGMSFTDHWHAEVTNLHDFVAWCLSGPTANLEAFLSPNLVELNKVARLKEAEDLGIPGVKGVKETSSTVRS